MEDQEELRFEVEYLIQRQWLRLESSRDGIDDCGLDCRGHDCRCRLGNSKGVGDTKQTRGDQRRSEEIVVQLLLHGMSSRCVHLQDHSRSLDRL